MNLRQFTSVSERRKALEEEKNISLRNSGIFSLDEHIASSRHCENMIGVTQIPLGIAGPLKVKHLPNRNKQSLTTSKQAEEKEYYIPLATTEGALIASVNRGCKGITQSGGASVIVERVGTTRGPVFKTESIQQSIRLRDWIESHQQEISVSATKTSTHITFLSSFVQIVGTLVYIRFSFDTQDAMGMNMVTIATQSIAEFIEEQTGSICLSISGNFCTDKKSSWQNVVLGRGYRAWSEVFLSTDILETIFSVSSDALLDTWQAKCMVGSIVSGSLGFNGHAANIIAALYLATGQDLAHVVEGSSAITTMEKINNGIAVRVSIPSILVGTVGGGTSLATQKEALELLGVYGGDQGNNGEKLAGITAVAVLAGEISELSALATGSLTKAHQKLARGK